MGIMPDVWNKEYFSVRQDLNRPACVRGEVRPINLPAQNQCFGLYVRPVVYNCVERAQIPSKRADILQAWPVTTKPLAMPNTKVLDELWLPIHIAPCIGSNIALVGLL